MSRTLQLLLLELALLALSSIVGIVLVATTWLAGWLVWLVWRLFYVAWAGEPRESHDEDVWPDRPARHHERAPTDETQPHPPDGE